MMNYASIPNRRRDANGSYWVMGMGRLALFLTPATCRRQTLRYK
jgi:hypothetical protein